MDWSLVSLNKICSEKKSLDTGILSILKYNMLFTVNLLRGEIKILIHILILTSFKLSTIRGHFFKKGFLFFLGIFSAWHRARFMNLCIHVSIICLARGGSVLSMSNLIVRRKIFSNAKIDIRTRTCVILLHLWQGGYREI
jgi:hypothetical protein